MIKKNGTNGTYTVKLIHLFLAIIALVMTFSGAAFAVINSITDAKVSVVNERVNSCEMVIENIDVKIDRMDAKIDKLLMRD